MEKEMEKIYIIEKKYDLESYISAIQSKNKGKEISYSDLLLKAGAAALTMNYLPIKLIGVAATVSPMVLNLFSNKDSDDIKITKEEAKILDGALNKYSLTIEETRGRKLKFPPGHPIVGLFYRLHPLDKINPEKESLYIPDEYYEQLLLQEREAELLKVLINLGATKIKIIKISNKANSKNIQCETNVEASANVPFSVDAGINKQSHQKDYEGEARLFELAGKKWVSGDLLDKKEYSWLPFEPQWGSLILAREIGGCTRAAVEMTSKSIFSADVSARAKLQTHVMSSNAELKIENTDEDVTSYKYEVDFMSIQ
ncbi:hypothetical protein [Pectobacterium brasiliense]|uniref:hypothetical protein n=1 Tax=Pectobacterium brasiliense TaxID=180957 RepID=UPI0015DFC452|nr:MULTISPECIES: hypothetical protein [Pectobacterium]MBA0212982.1 hypothetical protein [Pectobacterium brasiliense]MBN3066113.1 hypothetical protein [Pectobacterium aquaticum]